VANIFAAENEIWSDEYCDALGGNCFSPTDIGNTVNQQNVQVGTASFSSGSSVNINFPSAYTSAPQVIVSIKGFNNIKPEYGYTNVGATVSATNITASGFTITGTANGGGNLQVSWLAVGN
jgi:hypothetical protein